MACPVVHFEIQSQRSEELQRYYAELFGWKIEADAPTGYGMATTGSDVGINGGIGPAGGDGVSRVTFYVQAPDLKRYLARAEELGGRVVMPPTEIPGYVAMALFRDPDGNLIGLVEG